MPLDATRNLLILLERAGSGDQRSIQLSYRRAVGPRCFLRAQLAGTSMNIAILSGMIRWR